MSFPILLPASPGLFTESPIANTNEVEHPSLNVACDPSTPLFSILPFFLVMRLSAAEYKMAGVTEDSGGLVSGDGRDKKDKFQI